MNLIHADITGFGHYRNQKFDFTPGNQLFFGANEAGKSTLYQFILTILFGFPNKRGRIKDYTPRDGSAYGGRLVIEVAPYGALTIERFKQTNRGQAKVYYQQEVRDEKFLEKILAPLNRQLFQQVFTFQQEQLQQLDDLKESELHEALISLGISGSRELMAKRSEYLANAQKVFKPRGQKLLLNQKITEYQHLQQQLQQKELAEASVQDLLLALQNKEQELAKLSSNISSQEAQLLAIKEQMNYQSQYEEWQFLQKSNAAAPEENGQDLASFYQQYLSLNQQVIEYQAQLKTSEDKAEFSERYRFYLDNENEIQQLLKQQVTAVRITDEFQQGLAKQEQLFAQLEELEQRYGWSPANPPKSQSGDLLNDLADKQGLVAQMQAQSQQIQWLENQIDQQLEEQPMTPKETRKNHLGPIGLGILVLATIGFFLKPATLPNWPFMLLALAGALLFGWTFFNKQKTPRSQSFLSEPNGRIAELQQNLQSNRQSYQQAQVALATIDQKLDFLNNEQTEVTPKVVQDYQSAVANYLAFDQELLQLESRLGQLDQEYGQFMTAFNFLQNWLPIDQADLLTRMNALANFQEEMVQIKLRQKQQPADLIREQLRQKQQQLQQLLNDNHGLLKQAGIHQPTEIPVWLDRLNQLAENQRREQELAELLQPLFPQPVDFKQLANQLAKSTQQLQQLKHEQNQLTQSYQRQLIQTEQLQQDGTLDTLRQKASTLLAEIKKLTLDWGAQQLSAALLKDLATELSQQQLPQLMSKAGDYLNILTGGRYYQLDFDQGELTIRNQQQQLSLSELSTGTRDQLVMAIRFGYLALQKQRPLAPVIIDDGWLHYDYERKNNLAKLLKEFGQSYQVICLSSDREMVSYYQNQQQTVQKIEVN